MTGRNVNKLVLIMVKGRQIIMYFAAPFDVCNSPACLLNLVVIICYQTIQQDRNCKLFVTSGHILVSTGTS